MIKNAYQNGALAALKQFGVREASALQWLAGMALPMASRAGLNVMAPKLMPTIEKSFEAPFRAVKDTGRGLLSAIRGPSSPEEALVRGLKSAPTPNVARAPSAIIGGVG
jgi:hypothetical protein